MKKIIITALVILAAAVANAQLKNTKWKGTLQLDNPMDLILNFRTDTLLASMAQDGSVIETMSYSATDSTFTFEKISGQSDCSTGSKATYRFDIKENALSVKTISDACDARSYYLNNTKWTKMQ
jgi:hypothetical protein